MEETRTPDLSNIPLEVLSLIFEFLSASDRLVASTVCREWLSVCSSHRHLRDILVTIDDADEVLQIFQSTTRPFCNFHFKNMKVDESCFAFLKNISGQLAYLCFQQCEFSSAVTCDLKKISRLKELHFENCDLPNWKHENSSDTKLLNLTGFGYCTSTTMTDLIFFRLSNIMPNLDALVLGFCQTSYSDQACRRFYPGGFNPDSPSDDLFSYYSVEYAINKKSQTLTSLELSNTLVSASFLLRILKIKDLHLKNLVLSMCNECIPCLLEIPTYQKNIVSLNFGYMYTLTDDILFPICDNLHNLEELILHYCQDITAKCLIRILQSKCIRKLDLCDCIGISKDGFELAVCDNKCSLEELNLSRCNITDKVVIRLSQQHKNLRNLDLSYSTITSLSLQSISKHLLNLRHLTTTDCENITSFSEDCALSDMKCMKQLSFHGCNEIKDSILNTIKFLELEYLNLSSIAVTDEMVEKLGRHNPSIKELILRDCRMLTDEVTSHIVRYFSRIRYLELFGCRNVTDSGIYTLKKARSLKNLGIAYCCKITDEAIKHMQSYNKRLSIQHFL